MDIRTFLRLLMVAFCSTAVAKADVKCQDPNAIYNPCGKMCWRNCDNVKNPPLCPDICFSQLDACICKDGYAVDETKVEQGCVPVNSCSNYVPPTPKPRPGLEYMELYGTLHIETFQLEPLSNKLQ